eukprot:230417-Chlamydomonas_euryale.AAC.1
MEPAHARSLPTHRTRPRTEPSHAWNPPTHGPCPCTEPAHARNLSTTCQLERLSQQLAERNDTIQKLRREVALAASAPRSDGGGGGGDDGTLRGQLDAEREAR